MTSIEEAYRNPRMRRLLVQERAVMDATELVCEMLEKTSTSRSTLARRLRLTPQQLNMMLDGSPPLNVRKLADAFYAMGLQLRFHVEPLCDFPAADKPADTSPSPAGTYTGERCPACNSADLRGGRCDPNGCDTIFRDCSCEGCGARWVETYELRNTVSELELGDPGPIYRKTDKNASPV